MTDVLKKTGVMYSREPRMNDSNKLRLVKIIIVSLGVFGVLLFSRMVLDILDDGALGLGQHEEFRDIGHALYEWAWQFVAE